MVGKFCGQALSPEHEDQRIARLVERHIRYGKTPRAGEGMGVEIRSSADPVGLAAAVVKPDSI